MLTRHDVRRRLQRWTKLGERIDGLRAMIRAILDDIDGVGDLKSPRDEVRIALRNELPEWVIQSSSDNDTSSAASSFPTTTLGLQQLLGGMFDAMKGGNSFFEITIQLQR